MRDEMVDFPKFGYKRSKQANVIGTFNYQLLSEHREIGSILIITL